MYFSPLSLSLSLSLSLLVNGVLFLNKLLIWRTLRPTKALAAGKDLNSFITAAPTHTLSPSLPPSLSLSPSLLGCSNPQLEEKRNSLITL